LKPCILADRLYVPDEYVTPEHLNEFVYETKENDGYDYGPFQIVTGSIRTFTKAIVEGQLYYAFSRGNLEKLNRLFGDVPWLDRTSVVPITSDLQFRGKLHTWESKQIGQQEAVDTWLKVKCGLIRAHPRFGKTISSIYILTKLKQKTLIIAHQIDLLEQFYNSFVSFTNINEIVDVAPKQKKRDATGRIVGFFSDYDNPEDLDVCLLCWQTFASKAHGAERILKYAGKWGFVIVDECHSYQTPVLIDYDKYMPIGEVYENPNITHVLSYNLDKKCLEKKAILARRCHKSDTKRVAIYVRGENYRSALKPTENHKYYVVDKGYVEAKNLSIGDRLLSYNKETKQIVECVVDTVNQIKKAVQDKRVYNLEVEENHNYFVVGDYVTVDGRITKNPTTPILVSNCHKVGGVVYARTVNRIRARYRLGLTGTVERVDGREFLLKDLLGAVVAEGRAVTIPCRVIATHTAIPINYKFTEPYPYLPKRIYKNEDRMAIVLKDLEKDVADGRYICFAFHLCSVKQLCEWTAKLKALGMKAEAFYGACYDREGVLVRARTGETQVLVCNARMLTGIDIPRWNTYYSAFPTSNIVFNEEGNLSGNFVQEFSRIRTPFTYEDGSVKTEGLIRDYVDNNSLCYGSFNKRKKAYLNQKFSIEVKKLSPPKPELM
jgi:superfamily II DNA or RNA helicase